MFHIFDQTQFFTCIIVILFILLFASSHLDNFDSTSEMFNNYTIPDDTILESSKTQIQETNKIKAVDIAQKHYYSFYEYLKTLDNNDLSEPYEIRTIEFWMQNKNATF
jgi:hypothetical protein